MLLRSQNLWRNWRFCFSFCSHFHLIFLNEFETLFKHPLVCVLFWTGKLDEASEIVNNEEPNFSVFVFALLKILCNYWVELICCGRDGEQQKYFSMSRLFATHATPTPVSTLQSTVVVMNNKHIDHQMKSNQSQAASFSCDCQTISSHLSSPRSSGKIKALETTQKGGIFAQLWDRKTTFFFMANTTGESHQLTAGALGKTVKVFLCHLKSKREIHLQDCANAFVPCRCHCDKENFIRTHSIRQDIQLCKTAKIEFQISVLLEKIKFATLWENEKIWK